MLSMYLQGPILYHVMKTVPVVFARNLTELMHLSVIGLIRGTGRGCTS